MQDKDTILRIIRELGLTELKSMAAVSRLAGALKVSYGECLPLLAKWGITHERVFGAVLELRMSRFRVMKGLSQRQVANALHMPLTRYALIENGEKPCSLETAKALAELLEFSVPQENWVGVTVIPRMRKCKICGRKMCGRSPSDEYCAMCLAVQRAARGWLSE